ncbi:hypothetical protein B566_EDAN015467 [Ephemera danica]|nr:hypothetical protein B566_EDAN015467 [Ephemera danica]
MLSWFAKTREDAQATCCSLNMTLVSMEDATKSECLSKYYKSMSFAPTTFWSSGSDGGCPGKWIWCNTGETFAEGIDWAPGQPKSASDSSGNCVESSMSVDVNPPVTLLKVKACDLKNKFICQKAVPEPANSNAVATVVPPVSCVPVCRKPSAAITCSIDKTREEAERTCCSLNMTLVSMEDATKSDCLANYYKMLAFTPTTFWTSGSDEGCPGQWTWCNTGSPFAAGVQWAPGQPKSLGTGKGNCIETAMAVNPPATQLAVKACADTNKFICQTDHAIQFALHNYLPASAKLMLQSLEKLILINPPVPFSVGISRTVCGRLYMLSWIAKSREEAELTCCSLNMTVVSMEDATKSECLANFYKTLSFLPTTFWSSGTDGGCSGKWIWCNSGSEFAKGIQWAPGQPKATGEPMGNCVESQMSVNITPPVTLLSVKPCSRYNKFICQKPDPPTIRPYNHDPGHYNHNPGPYNHDPGHYNHNRGPYNHNSGPYNHDPGRYNHNSGPYNYNRATNNHNRAFNDNL